MTIPSVPLLVDMYLKFARVPIIVTREMRRMLLREHRADALALFYVSRTLGEDNNEWRAGVKAISMQDW